MEPIQSIRVLLVDDSPDFLQLLADFLGRSSWITVVGTAMSGGDALAMVQDLQPDLVVMDLAMPRMNGMEAACRIKQLAFPPRVIVVTLHDGHEYRTQAAAVGVDGFLSKADTVVGLLPLVKMLFAKRGIQ